MPSSARTWYLVRHAIAEARGEDWPDDTQRPLTRKGVSRMRQVSDGLRELGVELDLVLTSPLVRAQQTAEVLVSRMKPAPDLAFAAALALEGGPPAVLDAVSGYPKARSIALVGHEPSLGILAAWLVGAREPFVFKRAAVCRIDFEENPRGGQGQLIWMATPAMLRAVGNQ